MVKGISNYAQKVAESEDRLHDDEGGHLIASIFKGSGDLDNLVPMNSNLNKGDGLGLILRISQEGNFKNE